VSGVRTSSELGSFVESLLSVGLVQLSKVSVVGIIDSIWEGKIGFLKYWFGMSWEKEGGVFISE
jgi:hypothetical protein